MNPNAKEGFLDQWWHSVSGTFMAMGAFWIHGGTVLLLLDEVQPVMTRTVEALTVSFISPSVTVVYAVTA